MDKIKGIWTRIFALLVIGLIFVFILFFSKKSSPSSQYSLDTEDGLVFRIGTGDDSSSLVFKEMEEMANNEYRMKAFYIRDCCTTTSQWALQSDVFSVAVVCKEAAKKYLETNKDFIMVGPVVSGADIVVESERPIKKVGITQNKNYLYKELEKIYGSDFEVEEMSPQSLPYAMESGLVDAIMTDTTKLAPNIEGKVIHTDLDSVSHVMIARKDFYGTREFKLFAERYNSAVSKLSDRDILLNIIRKYTNFDERRIDEWKIKFLKIE